MFVGLFCKSLFHLVRFCTLKLFVLQGVHTSPKGLTSNSGFVFGENLAERVQFKADKELAIPPEENNGETTHDVPNSTEQGATAGRWKVVNLSDRFNICFWKKSLHRSLIYAYIPHYNFDVLIWII